MNLAAEALPKVKAPTLLIVGGNDDVVIGLNEKAFAKISCEKELKIVPGATHLFEEPGTLERVAHLASAWFKRKLQPRAADLNSSALPVKIHATQAARGGTS